MVATSPAIWWRGEISEVDEEYRPPECSSSGFLVEDAVDRERACSGRRVEYRLAELRHADLFEEAHNLTGCCNPISDGKRARNKRR